MQLQTIAESVSLSDPDSVKIAMAKLRRVPDHELHFYLAYRGTASQASGSMRNGIVLAQVELERRRERRRSLLAYSTTTLSGLVGLGGVLIGALLAR